MKVLKAWLQNHIKEKLPTTEKLSDLFTFHAFEVEGIEKFGDNAEEIGATVLDVKILPDRAHYALSHQGIAREVVAITGLTLKQLNWPAVPATLDKNLSITIEEPTLVRRYIGRQINNISVKESPDYFKQSLQAIGQRSINNVVDATNIVMFDIGQPMHAFDADKVVGDIVVRKAKRGETIRLLTTKKMISGGIPADLERTLILDGSELVIADEDGALALAGVKGGSRAEITETTKNIIIESANFDPALVRKTATVYDLRNESSKRFENELSPETAEHGMAQISGILKEFNPHAEFGEIVDMYPNPVQSWTVTVTPQYISGLLGVEVHEQEIISILKRMDIAVSHDADELLLTIPYWRLDLKIPQDIAEEVGRIYGYDKILAMPLPPVEKMSINNVFYWSEYIKDLLKDAGYAEVLTYTLTDHGEVKIQNPLASDKGFLRENLYEGLEKALITNSRNAPLLGIEDIKVFEIGTVFGKNEQESLQLAIGFSTTKTIKHKEKIILEAVQKQIKDLGAELGVELVGMIESSEAGIIFETNLSELIAKLPSPKAWDIETPAHTQTYKPFSAYPFALRDIAVFTPEGTKESEPLDTIVKEGGALLVRHSLFDVFTKTFPDGTKKTSYAFRMVFQSHERTLNEDEINDIMKRITDAMNAQEGWQVR